MAILQEDKEWIGKMVRAEVAAAVEDLKKSIIGEVTDAMKAMVAKAKIQDKVPDETGSAATQFKSQK